MKLLIVCNNSGCGSVFPAGSIEEAEALGFMCPACNSKTVTHHIIQCRHCYSIVNFIPVYEDEEPVIFYVKKCSLCGDAKEERNLSPSFSKDIFI
ncbi:hypothetical protein MROS_1529 [Melioribacter roseus P3M-2]|uniref:Uncharacterized protein n=1 Tax=Melioribacter roseus (strain DSM 23840 / JCM 17771 / VKM B-2668 / P3M-2) TaxID=1191523 RepID=I7A4D2_MELRP|nr:hypothetical protein [Melioribacter roseus]AFN74766.1 hypothetical protein MROS_1529 [Melioribacter roseus P3M-2]